MWISFYVPAHSELLVVRIILLSNPQQIIEHTLVKNLFQINYRPQTKVIFLHLFVILFLVPGVPAPRGCLVPGGSGLVPKGEIEEDQVQADTQGGN